MAKYLQLQRRDSAVLIQSAFRALHDRHMITEWKDHQEHELQRCDSATHIQAAYRGHQGRKEAEEQKLELERKNSAVQIQSAFRGYKGRELAENRRSEFEASEWQDIISVQAHCRRLVASLQIEKLESIRLAGVRRSVTELQSVFRANKIRHSLSIVRLQVEKEHDSAIRIQTMYRGHRARDEYRLKRDLALQIEREKQELLDEQNRQAARIQAHYRGHLGRKKADELRAEFARQREEDARIMDEAERIRREEEEENRRRLQHENDQAVKIQAAYRGRLGRAEFDRKRDDLALQFEENVTIVQSLVRLACETPKVQHLIDERDHEMNQVTKIQAMQRGRKGREKAKHRRIEKRKELEDEAMSKLEEEEDEVGSRPETPKAASPDLVVPESLPESSGRRSDSRGHVFHASVEEWGNDGEKHVVVKLDPDTENASGEPTLRQ
eukprot:913316_1